MSVPETNKAKSVVFIQLTGGNDALNTVIPYTDQNYFDTVLQSLWIQIKY